MLPLVVGLSARYDKDKGVFKIASLLESNTSEASSRARRYPPKALRSFD
jgi:hypothetical protein